VLGVRRTAESNKAKHMPVRDPTIRALKGFREQPRVQLLHHASAGSHIEGIGGAQCLVEPRPRSSPGPLPTPGPRPRARGPQPRVAPQP
jgi:hypothetical protein